jgi:hypothetical protein
LPFLLAGGKWRITMDTSKPPNEEAEISLIPSQGVLMARMNRSQCNALSREEREHLMKSASGVINGALAVVRPSLDLE